MIRYVSKDSIDKLPLTIKCILHRGMVKTGLNYYYTVNDVLTLCKSELWHLWILGNNDDALAITSLQAFPTGLKEYNVGLVAGKNMESWLEPAFNTFKKHAVELGCKYVTGQGRKGWVRTIQMDSVDNLYKVKVIK